MSCRDRADKAIKGNLDAMLKPSAPRTFMIRNRDIQ